MKDLPDYLKQGDDARLIPVVKDSNGEARLLSPVMAAMAIVPEFASAMLGPIGVRVGKTTKVRALAEVVFNNEDHEKARPDGLIILTTGKREYRLLIEAKAKNATLTAEQVEMYLELARAEKIDGVLTISNEFTANAQHSPVKVRSTLLRKVALLHMSWSMVAANVDLMLEHGDIDDDDRVLVMGELQRFLAHPSSGVSGFTQMNKEWRDAVKAFSSGAVPRKTDDVVTETVAAWLQEQKDMCIILSRDLGRRVVLKLARKHRDSAEAWAKDSASELVDTNCLRAEIDVPDAAAPIMVEANLARKTLALSARIKAPADRVSARARCNWLLRQINEEADERLQIRLHYAGVKAHKTFDVAALREKPEIADEPGAAAPNYLEVRLHDALGSDFSGSKKFIERLEANLEVFYLKAVLGIKNWQPSAPKPIEKTTEQEDPDTDAPQIPSPGDLH